MIIRHYPIRPALLQFFLLCLALNFGAQVLYAAPVCFQHLQVNKVAEIQTLPLLSTLNTSTILDFDADGISDIVSVNKSNSKTTFNINSSLNHNAYSEVLRSGNPVPADYDGDGKWDSAVAHKSSRGIIWNIKLSSTGEEISRTIGKSSSSLIYGCRFLSADKYSIATFDGRKLVATEVGTRQKRAIVFTQLNRSEPIGCGDATGDGIDELIIKSPSTSKAGDEISTVSCVNDNVDYGSRGSGTDMFVLDTGVGEIPAIGFQRLRAKGQILVRLNPLYDAKRFPNFYLPANTKFSFGKFSASDDTPTLGIIWQHPKTRVLTRQVFSNPGNQETVLTLNAGNTLVKPQAVIDNSDID